MNDSEKYAYVKQIVNAIILLMYLVGFLVLGYGSWEILWKQAGNPPLSQDAFITFMLFSAVIGLTVISILIKNIVLKEAIKINFWTFVPVIYYVLIYGWFSL